MHPAVESFVFAGVIPAVACGAIAVCGVLWAARLPARFGWIVAVLASATGVLAALSLANWRKGLVEWRPEDAFDWLLWAPPLLALASACVWAMIARHRRVAVAGAVLVIYAAWLVTPDYESLGGTRWLWLAATAAGAAWLWFAVGWPREHGMWAAPFLLAVASCGEAVLLALSGSLRLADLATVAGAVAGAAVLHSLVTRGERMRPLAQAAIFAHSAGASLLLAAVSVYGAMENYSETPDFAFYLPLVIPAVALMLWRRRTDAAAEAA